MRESVSQENITPTGQVRITAAVKIYPVLVGYFSSFSFTRDSMNSLILSSP